MPRKKMILEEIEERNDLVPGSPDNPVKLGERMKGILVRLALNERTGAPPPEFLIQERYHDEKQHRADQESAERLQFLGLVEPFQWKEPDKETTPENAARILELYGEIAEIGRNPQTEAVTELRDQWKGRTYDYSNVNTVRLKEIHDEIWKLRGVRRAKTETRWRLTEAGRELLLKGSVTVSL